MATYYHKHPRNLANECSYARAETGKEAMKLERMDYERIPLADLKRHLAWINNENDARPEYASLALRRLSVADIARATDIILYNADQLAAQKEA